jgi:hypothetical protein
MSSAQFLGLLRLRVIIVAAGALPQLRWRQTNNSKTGHDQRGFRTIHRQHLRFCFVLHPCSFSLTTDL